MGQASNPQEDEGSGSGRFAETTGRPREICSNLRCASRRHGPGKLTVPRKHAAPRGHTSRHGVPAARTSGGRAGGASAGPAAERPSPTGPRGPCTVSVPGDSHINDVLGGTQVLTTASSGPQVQGVRAGEAGGPRPRSSAFPLHGARPSVRMTLCGRTEPLPALGLLTAQPQPRGQRSAPPPRWDALQIG